MPLSATGPVDRFAVSTCRASDSTAKPIRPGPEGYQVNKTYSIPRNNKPKIDLWQGWLVLGNDPKDANNVIAMLVTAYGE